MEALNWVAIGGIIVDLVIISMIISNAFWGYRRGLTAVVFKLLVSIVSLLIVFVLYKPVAASIINKTTLDEKLAGAIEKNLSGTSLADGALLQVETTNVSSGIAELINSFVTEALQKAESNVIGYVSVQLAYFMIRVATLLILFIITRFLLLFVRFAAELIANLPFIRLFNKSGGLIYGIIKGFLVAYVILAVFSLISPLISEFGIINAIEDSHLGSKMYNNNIILDIIK